ncbi:MAG: putative transport system permease protein, partial [Acidimicrobiaceae bacterium]
MVVLGVLAGLTAGFAMAALAGARRSDTALSRFRATTKAADAVVFASQVGVPHPDWSKLRDKPEVQDLAVWALMFGVQDGDPSGLLFVSEDGFGTRIGTPRVIEGRLPDPNADDEVVATPALAQYVPDGKLLGYSLTFQSFGAGQGDSDAPSGPTFTFKVVGVVETINYFLFTDGQVFVGPGFFAKHGQDVQLAENVDVQLHNGVADIPALQRDVNEVVAPGTPVLDLHAASRRVDTTISVERAALLMLAVAIAVAGGLLVAQALGRSASVIGDDALVLRAIGMTRPEIAEAATFSHVVVFLVALVVALGTAIAASQLFPVGLSRKVDPDVGVHVDWTVLGSGLPLLAVLLVGGTMLVARRAARDDRQRVRRTSRLIAAVRGRAPLTVGIGTTMALDGGTGRTRVSVRPALVGAVVGVLGVVGALTIQHGVDDSLAHPERAGVTWDATVSLQPTSFQPHGVAPEVIDAVAAAAPPGSAVASMGRFVVSANGVGVAAFAIETQRGSSPVSFAVTSGRGPSNDGEVAIGPKTAKDIGAGIGDTIEVGDQ